MKKIAITGGSGRFGTVLKKNTFFKNCYFPTKNQLNILNTKSIKRYLVSKKPKILIHLAALSRPMNIHDRNISQSIDLNIIGTANIVKICSDLKIKLIYFSTNYVYPSTKGNYNEESSLLPINNYAWSKLGGECAVKLYKNSLILRVCMAERPFIHKKAFADFKTNFIFHDEVATILKKLLNKTGIINLGGPTRTVYNFAKKYNPNVKKISAKKKLGKKFPLNSFMNLKKLNKIISKKS